MLIRVNKYCFPLLIILMLASCKNSLDSEGSEVNVIFLRHSTGGGLFNYGYGDYDAFDEIYNPDQSGVGNFFLQYNSSNGTEYKIKKRAYPSSAYPPPGGGWQNYPYDYWNIWVNSGGASEESLSSLAQNYDVIIWKHCFPGSQIVNDTGTPIISSEIKSQENYKLQYETLKTAMKSYPDTKFLVWTLALETGIMTADNENNSLAFVNWVRDIWDDPGDNIFLWDFYYLESNKEDVLYNAYPTVDAHPSNAFNSAAGPLFAQRVIDVIEGRGDSSLITGEAGSVKGDHWTLSP